MALGRRDLIARAAAGFACALDTRRAMASTELGGAPRILHNGRFATMDKGRPFAQAVALASGRFVAIGDESDVLRLKGPATDVVDVFTAKMTGNVAFLGFAAAGAPGLSVTRSLAALAAFLAAAVAGGRLANGMSAAPLDRWGLRRTRGSGATSP